MPPLPPRVRRCSSSPRSRSPGGVKTRLAASIGAARAAQIYRELTTLTLSHAVGGTPGRRRSTGSSCGARRRPSSSYFRGLATADRRRRCTRKSEATWAHGWRDAIADALTRADAVLLVGTDCPLLDADRLAQAAALLAHHDAVLGPAEDGGYVLVGARRPLPFAEIRWSSPHAFDDTAAGLARAGIHWAALPVLWDVDEPADLARWEALQPTLPVTARMKPKLLFLFPDGWDDAAFAAVSALRDEFDVVCEGFDLFRFPENANILWFDARRWIARMKRKYRRAGLAGVASTNEQYGALIAAILARELGLPGSDPAAIIRAQHKYYARQALAVALPDANPAFNLLPYAFGNTSVATADPGLPFPFFVKPVKAAFSVLARRVDNEQDLQRHLTFHPWETHIIKRLVRPFGDLMRQYSEFTVDPQHMMGEALLDGVQINVDGWMDRGAVSFFGIVDAVMYPGTSAFQRWEYPSRLPPAAQAAAFAVSERVMRALAFDHGAFNVELFWQPATNTFQVIEINPRLAAQFGDLYEKVDGVNPYSVLVDLCVGTHAALDARPGRATAPRRASYSANSTARSRSRPTRRRSRWLNTAHPDARLHTFIKHGNSRWRETKWLGNYRYAIVNLGGADRADLDHRFADVCRNVSFERDSRVRFAPDIDALRPGR